MCSFPRSRAIVFAGVMLAGTLAALPAGAQWIGTPGGSGDTSSGSAGAAAVTVAPAPSAGAVQPGGIQPGFAPGFGGVGGAPAMGPSPSLGTAPQGGANVADCQAQVEKLRTALEGSGGNLEKAVKKKRPPSELCPLFRTFASAQQSFYSYLNTNKAKCGVPDDVLKKVKANSDSVSSTRNRVCEVAKAQESGGGGGAAEGPPTQGSVSAGLGLPSGLPSMGAPPGGVFDTLGGDALR
ncbi:hypothetical protein GBB76_16625 [Ancylobacter sp. TS-1]|nr:hypothetical protein GBB76_16625 [Ancylobacter sp. TS-1]